MAFYIHQSIMIANRSGNSRQISYVKYKIDSAHPALVHNISFRLCYLKVNILYVMLFQSL